MMQVLDYQLVLNGNDAFLLQEHDCSLGVLLDLLLLLDFQVMPVGRVAFVQLRLMCQLWPYQTWSDLTTMVLALVASRLDIQYCSMLYMSCKPVWKLPIRTESGGLCDCEGMAA